MPTVIFADSFDHYAAADMLKKGWGIVRNLTAGVGRNGTPGMGVINGGDNNYLTVANLPTVYFEIAAKFNLNSVDSALLEFNDSGSRQVDLRTTAAGELKVTRNGTQLGVTSGLGLVNGTYYHIGFAATIHPTAGMYEVRVQGVSKLSAINQNTRNTSNNYVTTLNVIACGPGNVNWFDDVVVSTDGFCGDCRVMALLPQGAGNYNQWTVPATGYVYSGGRGDRRAQITITQNTTAPVIAGNAALMLDGAYGNIADATTTVDASKFIRFDFGVPRVITEATWYQSNNAFFGNWKWQGSNDASSWTDIGSVFALGNASAQVQTTLSANVTAYRYYQLAGVSGVQSSVLPQEIEFKIDNTVSPLAAWSLVDEAQMNSDLDYVQSNTPGQRISYDFAALGVAGNVKAVQQVVALRKDDAGSRQAALFARASGADYDGPAFSVTDTYLFQRRIWTTNPATSNPWNSVEVDAAQFGTKVVS